MEAANGKRFVLSHLPSFEVSSWTRYGAGYGTTECRGYTGGTFFTRARPRWYELFRTHASHHFSPPFVPVVVCDSFSWGYCIVLCFFRHWQRNFTVLYYSRLPPNPYPSKPILSNTPYIFGNPISVCRKIGPISHISLIPHIPCTAELQIPYKSHTKICKTLFDLDWLDIITVLCLVYVFLGMIWGGICESLWCDSDTVWQKVWWAL